VNVELYELVGPHPKKVEKSDIDSHWEKMDHWAGITLSLHEKQDLTQPGLLFRVIRKNKDGEPPDDIKTIRIPVDWVSPMPHSVQTEERRNHDPDRAHRRIGENHV
jgi:hypothetical protein